MPKNRPTPIIITSRESLDSSVADAVRLKLQAAELTARMEQEIADVQKRHQERILSVDREVARHEAGIFAYCQAHRSTLFIDKQSIDLLVATVGFRTSPPAVEKCTKKTTWDDIALRLEALDWGAQYVRYPEPEVAKAKLIADREILSPEQLRSVGISITQDEIFYIEPKSEIAQPTRVAA